MTDFKGEGYQSLENLRRIVGLQLFDGRFVKTRRFRSPFYVGDPANTVSIFSELAVDELLITAIRLSRNKPSIDWEVLRRISKESLTPLSYGGGIEDLRTGLEIVNLGFEKLVVNTALFEKPHLVEDLASRVGSQAISVSIDFDGNGGIYSHGGRKRQAYNMQTALNLAIERGAGEVILHSIDRDGMRSGFDLNIAAVGLKETQVPVICMGGAASREDINRALAAGVSPAATSMYVSYSGSQNVLLNFDSPNRLTAYSAGKVGESGRIGMEVSAGNTQVVSRRTCSRCVIHDGVPGSDLGEDVHVCAYCKMHDEFNAKYPTGKTGGELFKQFCSDLTLRRSKTKSKYDCILGVSGGVDSSFLLHALVEQGVKPLCVHFDNTWNSPVATENIYKMVKGTGADLITLVADNNEYDLLYKSFLEAGVKDVEAPTDIAFMATLYKAAEKYKIETIVEGHSFRTEGISPLGWLYMDGRYVEDVYKKFTGNRLKHYPNMKLLAFLRWSIFSKIKRVRPLYWFDYDKAVARDFLIKKYGWEWYGGHHLENRFTAFYHSYLVPRRFNIDFSIVELSARVRSGLMSRKNAINSLGQSRKIPLLALSYVKNRLGYTSSEFERLMTAPHRSHQDFRTYKKTFERLEPLFAYLLKKGRVPESFYRKFCLKSKD